MCSFIMKIFHLFCVAGSPTEQRHTEKCFFGWPHQLNFQTRSWLSTCELTLLLSSAVFANIVICDVLQGCMNTLNIALYMFSGLSWNYQQVQVSVKLCCKPRSTMQNHRPAAFHALCTASQPFWCRTGNYVSLCSEGDWHQETAFCHFQPGYLLCWSLLLVLKEICENLWSWKNSKAQKKSEES